MTDPMTETLVKPVLPAPGGKLIDGLLTPVRIVVPSGMERRIEYALDTEGAPASPVLAVKLQELFGLAATPEAETHGAFVRQVKPAQIKALKAHITAEKKACTSTDVTLVPHATLVAAVIQALTYPEKFTPGEFFAWISQPGTADLEIVETETGAQGAA